MARRFRPSYTGGHLNQAPKLTLFQKYRRIKEPSVIVTPEVSTISGFHCT